MGHRCMTNGLSEGRNAHMCSSPGTGFIHEAFLRIRACIRRTGGITIIIIRIYVISDCLVHVNGDAWRCDNNGH